MTWIAGLFGWALGGVSAIFGRILANPLGVSMVLIGLFVAWNYAIDNPRVRREALSGYVLQSKLNQEIARREEMERQLKAGQEAVAALNDEINELLAAQAVEDAQREKEIAEFQAKLKAAGADCARLDKVCIDWLLRKKK